MGKSMTFVKDTRTTYILHLRENFTEVLVQFEDEEPAWIPLETLEAMVKRFMSAIKRVSNES